MSFWMYRKDKSGKTHLWQIDFDPLIIMILIGLLAAVVGPTFFRNPSSILMLPLAFAFVGLAWLITSKVSLYRKGIWFSFGPGLMSDGYARLYKLAYILIGIGVLPLLLVAISRT